MFEFSVYICVYLVVLRMCFFLFGVFIYVFFCSWGFNGGGVDWRRLYDILCFVFFVLFFFEMMREWVVIIVYEQVCFDFFCIYFCFVRVFLVWNTSSESVLVTLFMLESRRKMERCRVSIGCICGCKWVSVWGCTVNCRGVGYEIWFVL